MKRIYVIGITNNLNSYLIKVPIEKETPKKFTFAKDEKNEHIIGNYTPARLYNKTVHKHAILWFRTAQDALGKLRELVQERVQMRKIALSRACSEKEYLDKFELLQGE